MKKYLAFLRGINVGGHKKFLKVDQLKMANNLEFENPQIYLHTGNWIFSSSEKSSEISKKIELAIKEKYGWEVPVLVFKITEIEAIVNNCPFTEEKKQKSYFLLLKEKPSPEKISEVEKLSSSNEEFYISEKCIYIFYEKGAGTAKFTTNWFEQKLKVTATARNYNTMKKIFLFK